MSAALLLAGLFALAAISGKRGSGSGDSATCYGQGKAPIDIAFAFSGVFNATAPIGAMNLATLDMVPPDGVFGEPVKIEEDPGEGFWMSDDCASVVVGSGLYDAAMKAIWRCCNKIVEEGLDPGIRGDKIAASILDLPSGIDQLRSESIASGLPSKFGESPFFFMSDKYLFGRRSCLGRGEQFRSDVEAYTQVCPGASGFSAWLVALASQYSARLLVRYRQACMGVKNPNESKYVVIADAANLSSLALSEARKVVKELSGKSPYPVELVSRAQALKCGYIAAGAAIDVIELALAGAYTTDSCITIVSSMRMEGKAKWNTDYDIMIGALPYVKCDKSKIRSLMLELWDYFQSPVEDSP